MLRKMKIDQLDINICEDRVELGRLAAETAHGWIMDICARQNELNMLFAAAPSQDEFLAALVAYQDIPWERINAFHMDEYMGLAADAPQRFSNYLKQRIFSLAPFKSVNYIDGNSPDPNLECERYSQLLRQHPLDIVCGGIGENGHIAFNDPHVADFADSQLIRLIELDDKSRAQQVNDGCFDHVALVPTHALTVTIPAIMAAAALVCMAPDSRKAPAVKRALFDPISEQIPASILRTHPQAVLFLDRDSAQLI